MQNDLNRHEKSISFRNCNVRLVDPEDPQVSRLQWKHYCSIKWIHEHPRARRMRGRLLNRLSKLVGDGSFTSDRNTLLSAPPASPE
ncbi:MAG TPA: hypothetical protein PKH39_16310 [Woeseiaceae bacterium]|nr:hypothetical protein [Woeseiaceae bacterium]